MVMAAVHRVWLIVVIDGYGMVDKCLESGGYRFVKAACVADHGPKRCSLAQ